MPTYIYKACNQEGKLVKGKQEFHNKSELADALKKEGLLLIAVNEGNAGFNISKFLKVFEAKSRNVEKKRDIFESFQKIKLVDVMSFSLQLSNMLEVGIALLDGLGILVKQSGNKKIGSIVKKIHYDVEAGSSFSASLGLYPEVFPSLFISMVKLGEATGHLDKTLGKLTEFLQHDMDLKEKLRSALIYPVILGVLGFLVVMFITTFVLPQFVQMFKEAGVALSLPTLILYTFGQAVKRFWYLFLFGAIFLPMGIKFALKRQFVKSMFDRIILKIPVVGPLAHKVILSRFAMTLSVLLAAGVPILESLKMVEKTVGNTVIVKIIKNACAMIGKGTKIADALKPGNKFPPDIIQMIAVGEETGSLDKMLAKISTFYDVDVENGIKGLTALMEPLFLIIMGIVVGFIMLSLFLPLFKMIYAIRV